MGGLCWVLRWEKSWCEYTCTWFQLNSPLMLLEEQRFFDNYKFVVYKSFCKIYVHIIWINNLVLFFHSDRLNVASHNSGWQGIHISQGCGKSDQRGKKPRKIKHLKPAKMRSFWQRSRNLQVWLFLVCTSVCGRAWVCS